MLQCLIAVLLLTGLSAAGPVAGAAAPPPATALPASPPAAQPAAPALDHLQHDAGVVWIDGEKTHPMFVPEELLNRIPLSELPVGREELRFIEGMLNPPPQAGDSRPAVCRGSAVPGIGRLRDDARPLEAALASCDLTFTGRVTALEGGLYLWGSYSAATMVHVRVDEVIRDDDQFLRPGQELRFVIEGGSISVGGSVMCTDSMYGDSPFRPKPGERVFVMGLSWPPDRRVVVQGTAYPLLGNRLIDIGYAHLRAPEKISLDDLRLLAKGAGHAQ